jgi:hypothetical protein
MGEGCFFFDASVQTFLNEIREVSDRILLTSDQRDLVNSETDARTWEALTATLSDDEVKLSKLYGALLPTFERAMSLSQLTTQSGS